MDWLSNETIDHLREVTELPDLSQTKYACLEKIASGGMGSVYLAEDGQLQRNIALKILDIPDPEGNLAARMLQEAHIIATLEHPSIVPIHDVGTLPDGRVYYTMKLVKGARLDEYLQKTVALPELLRMFQKICEGVAFAHAHKVVHRDLKPENIMVGDFGEVLVMDWGLAKLLSNSEPAAERPKPSRAPNENQDGEIMQAVATKSNYLTDHGTVMGTPAYMAPEQQRGEIYQIDERTDIYALGAILSFLLTRWTERAKQKKTHDRSFTNDMFSTRLKKLPKNLTAIPAKAMAENKDDRYPNALALRNDIENFLNGARVSAYHENLFEITWRKTKQNKFLIFLILTYVAAQLAIRLIGRL